MKVCGKKIPKGNLLLFFSFTVVSLCILLIVSATRAEHAAALLKNSLYSGHPKNFSIIESEEEDQWEDVLPGIEAEYKDFAIYVPVRGSDIAIRGIYVNGNMEQPPMISGEYFDRSTSWTGQETAVLGKNYEKDVSVRDGKKYYRYNDVDYEVIGIMGTEEESRINQMVLVDFKSAVRIAGINTQYVLDTKKESRIYEIGQKIYDLFSYPANVLIGLQKESEITGIVSYLSGDMIMDTMYVMILISFSLSTILITFIWFRFRRQLFYAWRLSGYGKRPVCLEISKRFYGIAGAGFVMGIILMYIIAHIVPDVNMVFMDACKAFGMTLGLGTIILYFCYFVNYNDRKVSSF